MTDGVAGPAFLETSRCVGGHVHPIAAPARRARLAPRCRFVLPLLTRRVPELESAALFGASGAIGHGSTAGGAAARRRGRPRCMLFRRFGMLSRRVSWVCHAASVDNHSPQEGEDPNNKKKRSSVYKGVTRHRRTGGLRRAASAPFLPVWRCRLGRGNQMMPLRWLSQAAGRRMCACASPMRPAASKCTWAASSTRTWRRKHVRARI